MSHEVQNKKSPNTFQAETSLEKFPDLPRDFKGVWIPREIWLHTELSWFEKMLWAEIDSLDCLETGCTASNKYFMKFFSSQERIIQMSISRLKKLGLIAQTHFDGRTRTLRSSLKSTYEIFCTSATKTSKSEVQKNAPLGCKKMHPPPLEPPDPLIGIRTKNRSSCEGGEPPAAASPVASLKEEEPSEQEREEIERRHRESIAYHKQEGTKPPVKSKKWERATLKSIRKENAIKPAQSTIERNKAIAYRDECAQRLREEMRL
jgi:hypothetical protein